MIVKSNEARILILGDRVRTGNGPGKGTRIDPGQEIDVSKMPEDRQELFLKCVKRAIGQGKALELVGQSGLSQAEVEAEARKAKTALVDQELAKRPKAEDKPSEKRGPGRPPKGESK